MYVDLDIVSDKRYGCYVEWERNGINPFTARSNPFRPTLKYIRTIAVFTIGICGDLSYSQ